MGKSNHISKSFSSKSFSSKGMATKSFGGTYSSEAQDLFDAVEGFPDAVKPFYNDLIEAFKSVGAWSETGFRCIACVPGNSHDDYLIDVKSLTKIAKFQRPSDITGLKNTANTRGSAKGYNFTGSTAHIDTGYISDDLQGLNSHCTIIVTYQSMSVANTFNSGAFQNPNSSIVAPYRSGQFLGDSWNITTGRFKYLTATGEAGVYMVNRKASNDIDLYVNGSVVLTGATSGGTRPTISNFLNTYNNSGSPSTRDNRTPICLYAILESGLSDANAVTLSAAISDWQTNMEMIEGSFDKLLILDGNSHTVAQFGKYMRNLETGLIVSGWDFVNVGVSGQTLTQMEADAATEVDTLYDAGNLKNIVVVREAVNEFKQNGYTGLATAYQTYCENRQAAGFQVVAAHMWASGSGGNVDGYSQETFDLKTDEFNRWLDDNWEDFADALVASPIELFDYRSNYASDADYSTAMDALRADSTYHYDTTHLTEVGYGLWKSLLLTAVNSL